MFSDRRTSMFDWRTVEKDYKSLYDEAVEKQQLLEGIIIDLNRELLANSKPNDEEYKNLYEDSVEKQKILECIIIELNNELLVSSIQNEYADEYMNLAYQNKCMQEEVTQLRQMNLEQNNELSTLRQESILANDMVSTLSSKNVTLLSLIASQDMKELAIHIDVLEQELSNLKNEYEQCVLKLDATTTELNQCLTDNATPNGGGMPKVGEISKVGEIVPHIGKDSTDDVVASSCMLDVITKTLGKRIIDLEAELKTELTRKMEVKMHVNIDISTCISLVDECIERIIAQDAMFISSSLNDLSESNREILSTLHSLSHLLYGNNSTHQQTSVNSPSSVAHSVLTILHLKKYELNRTLDQLSIEKQCMMHTFELDNATLLQRIDPDHTAQQYPIRRPSIVKQSVQFVL